MKLTASALQKFNRCGELYRLSELHSVPLLPTSAQIISRSVRDCIQNELVARQASGALRTTPDARADLERIVRGHLAGETFWSDAEAAQGQRRRFEAVMLAAQRMMLLWRAVVAPKISPHVLHSSPHVLHVGAHEIECRVEITEVSGSIRSTKVRSRRPEEGEASRDLSLALAALAIEPADGIPPAEATVDYLINTAEMQYVRQVVEFDAGMLAAAQERVKVALEAIDAGLFVPAPAEAWWCRSCQLRACCQYVA